MASTIVHRPSSSTTMPVAFLVGTLNGGLHTGTPPCLSNESLSSVSETSSTTLIPQRQIE